MKSVIKYTLAVTLAAGAANAAHHHQHRHIKRTGTKVEKRSPDVVVVAGATATVYQLDGKVIDPEKAKAGLEDGDFIIVGETTPTYAPPPPPSSTSSQDLKAQFIESKTSSSAPPPPPTTTAQPSPSPKPAQQATQGNTGGTGINTPFPNGKIPCSHFPSDYGAVPLNYLGFGGWSGIQFTDTSPSGLSISSIITAITGQGCGSQGPGYCSYACPPGSQKTQWPAPQGATGQSIGGLWCNADGYLELTRPESQYLCESGAGGVWIQNDLTVVVSTCRTDYPGTESMVIPAVANPGSKVAICNPDQSNYYVWEGKATSAQYYVNKKGYGPEDACVWNSPIDPLGAGNWSPVILGVGLSGGTTFISIFQNLPTSNAKLDFNIEITGDVNSKCSYINGQWSGGSNGCTTGVPKGGQATIRYF